MHVSRRGGWHGNDHYGGEASRGWDGAGGGDGDDGGGDEVGVVEECPGGGLILVDDVWRQGDGGDWGQGNGGEICRWTTVAVFPTHLNDTSRSFFSLAVGPRNSGMKLYW